MITRIHVNRHLVASDRKTGARSRALSVVRRGRTLRAHSVTIHGTARVVYRPDRPLSCGARAWIETNAPVTAHIK